MMIRRAPFALFFLLAACGASNETAKLPQAPAVEPPAAASVSSAPVTSAAAPSASAPASVAPATPAPVTSAAPAAGSKSTLTRAQLEDANKAVMAAYPGPFDKTYKAVVAKLGEPTKKGDNMFEWFIKDGDKCVGFFMTKDAKKGHAASGINADASAASCK
jgi:hypothetical protein